MESNISEVIINIKSDKLPITLSITASHGTLGSYAIAKKIDDTYKVIGGGRINDRIPDTYIISAQDILYIAGNYLRAPDQNNISVTYNFTQYGNSLEQPINIEEADKVSVSVDHIVSFKVL